MLQSDCEVGHFVMCQIISVSVNSWNDSYVRFG